MPDPAQRAKELFESGLNCSQAVVCAFSDVTGLDPKLAQRLASPLGGGMGRMREVCGAVSGMFMAAGMILGEDGVPGREEKRALYAAIQELAARYRAENGSIICRELLAGVPTAPGGEPEARTEQYYRKRPCPELCRCAAEILDHYLREIEAGVEKSE